MKGIRDVTIEPNAQKVTVVGYVEPNKVVARIIHRTGKRAELYPFVPYDVVAHPYASGVYDNRAPRGYVRNTDYDPNVSRLARASSTEVRYTTAFSDDNAAACVIMWYGLNCIFFFLLMYSQDFFFVCSFYNGDVYYDKIELKNVYCLVIWFGYV